MASRLGNVISRAASSSTSSRTKVARLNRQILELTGPDAAKFLNGLACRNVESLGGGYSGFLNASGRVLHTVFIHPTSPTSYLISHSSPPNHPAPLDKFLPPFRLRSKVRIRDVSDEYATYAIWGDRSPKVLRAWKLGSGGAAEAQYTWLEGKPDLAFIDGHGCWDLRAGGNLGRRLIAPKDAHVSFLDDADQADESDYDLYRMVLGVPEGPHEVVPEHALPLESCMDVHGGVDFRKGCYLGQELTVRTYHTGATRKRILPIRLQRPSASQAVLDSFSTDLPSSLGPTTTNGEDIIFYPSKDAASQKTRPAGKILRMHGSVTDVGLGLVRLEWAQRACWSPTPSGQLRATIKGEEWDVWVGQGEAYAASLQAAEDAAI